MTTQATAGKPKPTIDYIPPGPDRAGDGIDPEVAAEIARYIHQLSGELSAMARKSGMELLSYFLEMARIEAKNVERRNRR